jgi:tetratricopeptide (TPR) repeat protein
MKKMKVKGVLAIGLSMLSVSLLAQTVDDGITMYKFARYESAKKILEPLSASNPMANYYLGLAELGLENNAAAKTIFQKYPEDVANNAGTARVLFAENKGPEAMSMLTKTAAKAKKKDWSPLRYAADAITYSEGGDPNMAVQWYKKAIETERNGD